jgi:phage terminase small subunit
MCNLSINEERFVQEYVSCGVARQAYVRAYGCSIESAGVLADRLLKKVNIQRGVEKEREKLRERARITQDQLVDEYRKIAFAQMSDYVDWDADGVTLKDSSELQPDAHAAVLEVGEVPMKSGGKAMKIKLHDKKGALDSLGKMLGYSIERQEVKHEFSDLSDAELIERTKSLIAVLPAGD